jgi:hypothetical protein
MSNLPRSELQTLLQHASFPSISIYLPTHRGRADSRQAMIRFKNLLTQVEDELRTQYRRSDVAELLAPARKLLEDTPFWLGTGEGLAVFISRGLFQTYRLPQEFAESATVNDRFDIKPLIPLLQGDGRFYVLSLSLKAHRLLRCTRNSWSEVELPGVSKTMQEALQLELTERSKQFHSGTGPSRGIKRRAAVYFGGLTTADDETKKRYIRSFLGMMDKVVCKVLLPDRAPLVLAAVEYIQSIYREVSNYPNIVPEGIVGNAERWNGQELHEQACPRAMPLLNHRRRQAMAAFGAASNATRVSSDLRALLPVAYDGGVEVLFIPERGQIWGRYDPETRLCELHERCEKGDTDMLAFGALHTMLHGGEVIPLPPEDMPDRALAAGLLRVPAMAE